MYKPYLIGTILFIVILAFSSCSEDKNFNVGEDLLTIKSDVIVVDTSTINIYTVKADSIMSGNLNKALIGYYKDDIFGSVSSASCMQFDLPSSKTVDDLAVYDSISLWMKPSGYYYGDTTSLFKVTVHKLKNDLTEGTRQYYSNSKFYYDTAHVLGSFSSKVRPTRGDTISIPLDDALGQRLFNLIKDNDDTIKTLSTFLSFLPGLAIIPEQTSSSHVAYQFNITPSSSTEGPIMIRLFYHVEGVEEEQKINFTVANTSYQFNQIKTDLSTPLAGLHTSQDKVISSEATNFEGYCQAGTGLMTRIEFPNLNAIFQFYKAYEILSAQLIIKPVRSSYEHMSLPDTLYLYASDKYNDIGSALKISSSQTLVPTLKVDNMTSEAAYYADVTSYIQSAALNTLDDDPPSLLLSVPLETSGTYLDRLRLGDYNHPTNAIRLKITYWKYSK
jgi:hypothetical protein